MYSWNTNQKRVSAMDKEKIKEMELVISQISSENAILNEKIKESGRRGSLPSEKIPDNVGMNIYW